MKSKHCRRMSPCMPGSPYICWLIARKRQLPSPSCLRNSQPLAVSSACRTRRKLFGRQKTRHQSQIISTSIELPQQHLDGNKSIVDRGVFCMSNRPNHSTPRTPNITLRSLPYSSETSESDSIVNSEKPRQSAQLPQRIVSTSAEPSQQHLHRN